MDKTDQPISLRTLAKTRDMETSHATPLFSLADVFE